MQGGKFGSWLTNLHFMHKIPGDFQYVSWLYRVIVGFERLLGLFQILTKLKNSTDLPWFCTSLLMSESATDELTIFVAYNFSSLQFL